MRPSLHYEAESVLGRLGFGSLSRLAVSRRPSPYATAYVLDSRARTTHRVTSRFDRGLASIAIRLDHASDRISSLTLSVANFVDQLARQIQNAALSVSH